MLPPLIDEGGSMLTSVTLEQRNVDALPTASDAAASFKFKPQSNLDPNPLPASLNQVAFFIVIVIN